MTIKLEQVIEAIEMSDDFFTSFWDTKTGETVYLADPLLNGETDEVLTAEIENDPKRFLRFPTKYEIHKYRIMEDFIEQLSPGKVQSSPAQAGRVVIGDKLLAVLIEEEGGELPAQNGVQVHTRADAHHERANSQHLGDAKAHENGQDDDADGNDCARAEQGGEDRRSDDGEQNADNDRLIAAQLDGLANQSVRNTGFQQNATEPSAEHDIDQHAAPALRTGLVDLCDGVHKADVRHAGIRRNKIRVGSKRVAEQGQYRPERTDDEHTDHQVAAAYRVDCQPKEGSQQQCADNIFHDCAPYSFSRSFSKICCTSRRSFAR